MMVYVLFVVAIAASYTVGYLTPRRHHPKVHVVYRDRPLSVVWEATRSTEWSSGSESGELREGERYEFPPHIVAHLRNAGVIRPVVEDG